MILIVTHSLNGTGAPRVAVNMANALSEVTNVTVLNMNADHEELKRDLLPSVTVFSFDLTPTSLVHQLISSGSRRLGLRSTLRQIFFDSLLRQQRPSLVIFNTMYHSELQRVCDRFEVPSIRYLHEDIYLEGLRPLEIRELNRASCVLGCSTSVVNSARKMGIKVEVDILPPSHIKKGALASNFGTRTPKKSVVCVGSGGFRKGADYASAFSVRNPSIEVHWFGELEVSYEGVIDHGMVSEVPYETFSHFFLLSRNDPYGLAAIEALDSGLTVIGWDHLDLIDHLGSRGIGYGVPEGDLVTLEHAFYSIVHKESRDLIDEFLLEISPPMLYGRKLWEIIQSLT